MKVYSSTVYDTRNKALQAAQRIASQHQMATLWYLGYRQYTVTEYDPGDESKLEALRIVFADGSAVDAVQYARQIERKDSPHAAHRPRV